MFFVYVLLWIVAGFQRVTVNLVQSGGQINESKKPFQVSQTKNGKQMKKVKILFSSRYGGVTLLWANYEEATGWKDSPVYKNISNRFSLVEIPKLYKGIFIEQIGIWKTGQEKGYWFLLRTENRATPIKLVCTEARCFIKNGPVNNLKLEKLTVNHLTLDKLTVNHPTLDKLMKNYLTLNTLTLVVSEPTEGSLRNSVTLEILSINGEESEYFHLQLRRFFGFFQIGLYFDVIQTKLDFTFEGNCLQTFTPYHTGFLMSGYKCPTSSSEKRIFLQIKNIKFENEKTFFTLVSDIGDLTQVRFEEMGYSIFVNNEECKYTFYSNPNPSGSWVFASSSDMPHLFPKVLPREKDWVYSFPQPIDMTGEFGLSIDSRGDLFFTTNLTETFYCHQTLKFSDVAMSGKTHIIVDIIPPTFLCALDDLHLRRPYIVSAKVGSNDNFDLELETTTGTPVQVTCQLVENRNSKILCNPHVFSFKFEYTVDGMTTKNLEKIVTENFRVVHVEMSIGKLILFSDHFADYAKPLSMLKKALSKKKPVKLGFYLKKTDNKWTLLWNYAHHVPCHQEFRKKSEWTWTWVPKGEQECLPFASAGQHPKVTKIELRLIGVDVFLEAKPKELKVTKEGSVPRKKKDSLVTRTDEVFGKLFDELTCKDFQSENKDDQSVNALFYIANTELRVKFAKGLVLTKNSCYTTFEKGTDCTFTWKKISCPDEQLAKTLPFVEKIVLPQETTGWTYLNPETTGWTYLKSGPRVTFTKKSEQNVKLLYTKDSQCNAVYQTPDKSEIWRNTEIILPYIKCRNGYLEPKTPVGHFELKTPVDDLELKTPVGHFELKTLADVLRR